MVAQTKKAKINIDCTPDERVYIKMLAAKAHTTISEYMLSHVRSEFPQKRPNKETLEAMQEIDDGGGIECESIADFWQKMGIDRSAS